MKVKDKTNSILKLANNYLIFFLLVAFVITCCMMLFLSVLSKSLNISFTEENIQLASKITFANVIFLSLIFTLVDAFRRKRTIEKPVKEITAAAEKIVQGDFSVRIKPRGKVATDKAFDSVIDCFNKMAEELSSVETLRTDFIANVSHEMKTPLSIMQNYGTLLQTPGLSEEKRIEYAKGITEGSRRLADMMTNILKLNRLENQQIYPKTEPFNLSEQLCDCLLQYENVWEQKDIEIETDIAEDITVTMDKELMELVWNNLFSNAFKFTPHGGKVTVSLTATQNYAVVKVTDTGCGMTPEVGARIFEKFYQGNTSHSSSGNGLGLALVKRVIDITHGEISVNSIPAQGSSFTVKMRRRQNEL